jgi:hypothetical protein
MKIDKAMAKKISMAWHGGMKISISGNINM